jgi:hypothetical protein
MIYLHETTGGPMHVNKKNEKQKQFLLTVIKEELRIENKKHSKKTQIRREAAIEYSALAILLYDSNEAKRLITSYKIRKTLDNF